MSTVRPKTPKPAPVDTTTPLDPHSTLAIGMDIGGTHVAAAAVDAETGLLLRETRLDIRVDSSGPADEILECWTQAARHCLETIGAHPVAGIGVAMPGPFDYPRGIMLIKGLPKYQSLYGVNIRDAFLERLHLDRDFIIRFCNDAACFLLGEAWQGAARGHHTVLGITLGTGLGSAFLVNDRIVEPDVAMPDGKYLYEIPFHDSIADDSFSTRGVVARYHSRGGKARGAKEIAQRAPREARARAVLAEFGAELGDFLAARIEAFHPTCVVIGGNIAKAWEWFAPPLQATLNARHPTVDVRMSQLLDDAALLGAARLAVDSQFI